jgi:hypothetical protein
MQMDQTPVKNVGKSSKHQRQKTVIPLTKRRKRPLLIQKPREEYSSGEDYEVPQATLDTTQSVNIKRFNEFLLQEDYKRTAEEFQKMLNDWIEDM